MAAWAEVGEGTPGAAAPTSVGSRHPVHCLRSLRGAVSTEGWFKGDYSTCKEATGTVPPPEAGSAVAVKGHGSARPQGAGISWCPWLREVLQPMLISRLLQLPQIAVSKASTKVFIYTSRYKLHYIKLVP